MTARKLFASAFAAAALMAALSACATDDMNQPGGGARGAYVGADGGR